MERKPLSTNDVCDAVRLVQAMGYGRVVVTVRGYQIECIEPSVSVKTAG